MTIEKSPPKHIIFAGGFVFKEGKLLVAQRSMDEGHLPGYWAVPGGKVELEAEVWNIIEKTVQNEVLEETGIVIENEMTMFSNNSFLRTDGQPVIAINFICSYKSGNAEALDGTSDVRWVNEEELTRLKIESNTLQQMRHAFSLI
jgi:8-oxo-dGTP pyrophosphatase MutT (NUDIX family)